MRIPYWKYQKIGALEVNNNTNYSWNVGYKIDPYDMNKAKLIDRSGKTIGTTYRSVTTGWFWVSRHKKQGHMLYFTTPQPIAYGIAYGEYVRNTNDD